MLSSTTRAWGFRRGGGELTRFESAVVRNPQGERYDYDGRASACCARQLPGFGEAAARLAQLYRLKSAEITGKAVATEIQFVVHFRTSSNGPSNRWGILEVVAIPALSSGRQPDLCRAGILTS